MRRLRWLWWALGAYLAANVLWAIVRARVVGALALLALLAGCGPSIVLLRDPRGTLVECRENLYDGITDTLGKCVRAYEEAGFKVQTKQ